MATMLVVSTPLLVEFEHNGVSTGEVEGETVYDVEAIRVVNPTAKSYHVQIYSGAQLKYEDQIPGGQEKTTNIGTPFASYPTGYAVTTIN